MNLVIDVGNTCAKVCVFDSGNLVAKNICPNDVESVRELAGSLMEGREVDGAIVSSVSMPAALYRDAVSGWVPGTIALSSSTTPIPIENAYGTPATLGADRLAAAVGAQVIFPECNVLVIDAGTAVTYDFLKDGHVFAGGNIAPGMALRFKSLNDYTSRLPLMDISQCDGSESGFGLSTAEAIRNGVVLGMVREIDGYIDDFLKKNVNPRIILTGGDSIFLSKKLKNTIFAEPNLVLIGLNRILNYNVYKNF